MVNTTITMLSGNLAVRGSKVVVRKNGTLDMNEQESIISDITLDGGRGSGTVAEIMANSAKIKGGALPGKITSYGGLISGVTGADLKVDSGRSFLRDSTLLDDVIINGG